jgi:hypothetical protein
MSEPVTTPIFIKPRTSRGMRYGRSKRPALRALIDGEEQQQEGMS